MTGSHQPRSEEERAGRAAAAQFTPDAEADATAWEEIDAGRYMPRRIKGSYRGRALG